MAVLSRATSADHLGMTLHNAVPWIVFAWSVGVMLLGIRLVCGGTLVLRLQRSAMRPKGDDPRLLVDRLAERMRIPHPVRIAESVRVAAPMVVGILRPVILIPMTALTGLTPRQFAMILAHELAHIRRHDYLVNLLQTVVETLFFYHPAVWWLSRQIRNERENCCDDVAMATVRRPAWLCTGSRGDGRVAGVPIPTRPCCKRRLTPAADPTASHRPFPVIISLCESHCGCDRNGVSADSNGDDGSLAEPRR